MEHSPNTDLLNSFLERGNSQCPDCGYQVTGHDRCSECGCELKLTVLSARPLSLPWLFAFAPWLFTLGWSVQMWIMLGFVISGGDFQVLAIFKVSAAKPASLFMLLLGIQIFATPLVIAYLWIDRRRVPFWPMPIVFVIGLIPILGYAFHLLLSTGLVVI